MQSSRLGYNPGDRPVVGEDYVLEAFLGAGGFGEAWSGMAPGGVRVALKIIDLTRTDGEREFDALEKVKDIRHPNLCSVFSLWTIDDAGNVLQKQRLLTGKDAGHGRHEPKRLVIALGLGEKCLAKRLSECGGEGIPRDELLRYMEGAAKGLDYLHKPIHPVNEAEVAIIHRDIKPHNILIVGDDAQICDFGLAKAVASLQKVGSRTRTRAGSEGYMAPEIRLDNRPATPWSDQYSFAVTYFQLRTARMPYGDGIDVTEGEIFRAWWEEGLSLGALKRAERRVVAKATSINPLRRFANCREFVEELRQADNNKTTVTWLVEMGARLLHREEAASAPAPGSTPVVSISSSSGSATDSKTPSSQKEAEDRPETDNTTLIALDSTLSEFGEGSLAREFSVTRLPAPPDLEPTTPNSPGKPRRISFYALLGTAVLAATSIPAIYYKFGAASPPAQKTAETPGASPLVTSPVVPSVAETSDASKEAASPMPIDAVPENPPVSPRDLAGDWLDDLKTSLAKKDKIAEAGDLYLRLLDELKEPLRKEVVGKAEKAWLDAIQNAVRQMDPPLAKMLVDQAPDLVLADPNSLRQQATKVWLEVYGDYLGGKHADHLVAGEMLKYAPAGTTPDGKQPLLELLLEKWQQQFENCLADNNAPQAEVLLKTLLRTPLTRHESEAANAANTILCRLLCWKRERELRLTEDDYERVGEVFESLSKIPATAGIRELLETLKGEIRPDGKRADFSAIDSLLDHLTGLATFPETELARVKQIQAMSSFANPRSTPDEIAAGLDLAGSLLNPPSGATLLSDAEKDELLKAIGEVGPRFGSLVSGSLMTEGDDQEALRLIESLLDIPAAQKEATDGLLGILEVLKADLTADRGGVNFSAIDNLLNHLTGLATFPNTELAHVKQLQAMSRFANPQSTSDQIGEGLDLAKEILNPSQGKEVSVSDTEKIELAEAIARIASRLCEPTAPESNLARAVDVMQPICDLPEATENLKGGFTQLVAGQVELALGSVESQYARQPDWISPERLGSPFVPEAKLDVSKLEALWKKHGSRLPADLRNRAIIALVLTRYYGDKPKGLADLVDDLALLGDENLGPNAESVLLAAAVGAVEAAGRSDESKPRLLALRLSNRLLGRLDTASRPKAPKLSDPSVVKLYQTLLQPVGDACKPMVVPVADGTTPADDLKQLEQFHAEVGELLLKHQYAMWSFDDGGPGLPERVKGHFDDAISLFKRREGKEPTTSEEKAIQAGYLVDRGRSWMLHRPPGLEATEKDAREAQLLVEALPDAEGLLAHAAVERSRTEPQLEKRREDLQNAIECGRKAIDNNDASPRRSYHLITLASALIGHANTFGQQAGQEEHEKQKEELTEALQWAKEAAEIERDYPQYPNLVVGNAYEDLARLVGSDPAANYKLACEHYTSSNAAVQNAQAYLGIGRCYYQAIVGGKVTPAELDSNFRTADDVMKACVFNLGEAVKTDAKLVEAWDLLADVHSRCHEDAEAEKCRQKCIALAEQQQSSAEFAYTMKWILAPVTGVSEDELRVQEWQDVRARADRSLGERLDWENPANPVTQLYAHINGRIEDRKKNFEGALAEYDRGIPKDLQTADDFRILADWVASAEQVAWNADTCKRATELAKRAEELAPGAADKAELQASLFTIELRGYLTAMEKQSSELVKQLTDQHISRDGLLDTCRKLLKSEELSDARAQSVRASGIRLLGDKLNEIRYPRGSTEPRAWADCNDDELKTAASLLKERIDLLSMIDTLAYKAQLPELIGLRQACEQEIESRAKPSSPANGGKND
ncbi:MAG: protein kinase [Planctomycetaceae bacterium]|nr:protein kinase [Planctomycetaceae bacterium]